jgi:hypothetical protein
LKQDGFTDSLTLPEIIVWFTIHGGTDRYEKTFSQDRVYRDRGYRHEYRADERFSLPFPFHAEGLFYTDHCL